MPRDQWRQKHSGPKPTGHSKSCSKREVYINAGLPQQRRKFSDNLTLYLKQLEKEEQIKPSW